MFLSACEKENITPAKSEADSELIQPSVEYEDVLLSEQTREQVLALLNPKYQGGDKNNQAVLSLVREALTKPARGVESEVEGVKYYTVYLPTGNPQNLLNFIFETTDDVVTKAHLHLYELTQGFASLLAEGKASMISFVGDMTVLPLSEIEGVLFTGNGKNTNGDCFTLAFQGPSTAPVTGGGGTNSTGGNTGSTTGDPVGGAINWGSTPGYVGVIGAGGLFSGFGGGSSSQRGNPPTCRDTYEVVGQEERNGVLLDKVKKTNCVNGHVSFIYWPADQFVQVESSDKSTSDCLDMLGSIGILPRELSMEDMLQRTMERIETAVNNSCFDVNAVMHIIDASAYQSCTSRGTSGIKCVEQQIVNYLDDLDIVRDPSFSRLRMSFNGLTHDQLAAFFHAAVAGEDNQNVYAAISFARRNLNHSFIRNDLSEALLILSQIKSKLPRNESSEDAFSAILSVYNRLPSNERDDLIDAFVESPSNITTISDFLSENNYDTASRNVAKLFAATINDGEDFTVVSGRDYERELLNNKASYAQALSQELGVRCCTTRLGSESLLLTAKFLLWHQDRLSEEVAVLKAAYPNRYDNSLLGRTRLRIHAEYRVMSEGLHVTLDIMGLIPAIGVVPDVTNGVFYAVEGRGLDATLSFGSAIPITGLASGSWLLLRRIKWADHPGTKALRYTDRADGIREFKEPYQSYKKFWRFTGDVHGHHMIPKSLYEHDLIQRAAKSDPKKFPPFHIHDLENAYKLPTSRHGRGGHLNYNKNISKKMDEWLMDNPSATSEQAANVLNKWQKELKKKIDSSSGFIEDMIIPDIPEL